MARVPQLTNWLHFNGIVLQVFNDSVSCAGFPALLTNVQENSSLVWDTFIKSD